MVRTVRSIAARKEHPLQMSPLFQLADLCWQQTQFPLQFHAVSPLMKPESFNKAFQCEERQWAGRQ